MKTTPFLKITWTMVLSLLVLLTACSPIVVVVQPTVQPTQAIVITATAPAQPTSPGSAPTQTVPVGTDTDVLPTAIQAQAVVEQPAATSAPATTECQDSAQYITDDGLDGTTYSPNTPFTKTWTVKNTGSCTWDNSYLVTQLSGTPMSQQPAYLYIPQGQVVSPGQTVNISVGMISPVGNGSYRSDWGLQKRGGPLMPIQGGVNNETFYVKIRVNDGSSPAAGMITGATVGIEPEQGSGAVCTTGATYFVHISISADGPATASYQILSSAGQIAAGNFEDANSHTLSPSVSGNMVFDQAATKTIDLRFVGPYPYPDDITIQLLLNNDGQFHNAKLSCQS